LSIGEYNAGIRSIRQRSFKQIFQSVPLFFPSGSLDRSPPRLLILFRESQRDSALTSSGQPTGIELRIADCGSKKSAIWNRKSQIQIGAHN
jgi:hypothetical protein